MASYHITSQARFCSRMDLDNETVKVARHVAQLAEERNITVRSPLRDNEC